jgi:hypothetical protein
MNTEHYLGGLNNLRSRRMYVVTYVTEKNQKNVGSLGLNADWQHRNNVGNYATTALWSAVYERHVQHSKSDGR